MTINRLDPIEPIQPKKPEKAGRVERSGREDQISLSSEAVEKAELYKAMEIAQAAPDVRADRVAELKAKINDPAYIDDALVSLTADRIIDQLLG